MLRLLVLLLLLANTGYFAWTHGMLADYGFAPTAQSEPQRLMQQIRPEAMRLVSDGDAHLLDGALPVARSAAALAGAAATQCLQAGLFTDSQASALRSGLESSLPAGSWSLEHTVEPGRWIVYMGKYPNEEALANKRNELHQLGLPVEPLTSSVLEPGLSLGHYSARIDAERELAKVVQRGARTARVVLEQPEARGQLLRLPMVDASLKAQLEALKPRLEGKALQACR